MIRLLLALLGVALLAVLAIKMIPQSMQRARLKARQQISDSSKPEGTAGTTPGAPAATTPGGLDTPTTPAQEIRAVQREVNQIMRDGEQARQKQIERQSGAASY